MNGLSIKIQNLLYGCRFFLVLILAWSASSHALIRFEDATNPELAMSGRALAMGNAFICKVDDATSILYNPAGLGTIRNTHLHLSNFYIEVNKGWLNIGTSGKADDAISNVGKSLDLEGIRTLIKDHPGEIVQSRFSVMPNFTMRYFSLGYLYSNQIRATYGRNSNALYEYADRVDHGPYAGANVSLFGGILKFGATGIFLNRKEAIGEQDINAPMTLEDEYKEGHAFLLTAGGKLMIPMYALPTFAFVAHNSLDKNFAAKQGSPGNPTKVERTVNVGFSITPQLGNTTRLHLEINYKDLAKKYPGVSGQRRTTFGMEIDMWRALFIRFGYGDGFGSAGLGLKSQKLELDLTTYAVDTTSSEFRGEEDRRFAVNFSSGF